jgi:hypothetical protein
MAQVTAEVQRDIDRLLDHLLEAWQELPQVAREIDEWDLIEHIDYLVEWAPEDSQAFHLRQLMERHGATEAQHRRYEQLERLMRANRPILERLRAS